MFGPKIEGVDSSERLSKSGAFGMLSRFLRAEQEKLDAVTLQQSHWEDLYHVGESLVDDPNSADQETLRELRLMVAPPMSSPSVGGRTVFDQRDTTPSDKLIPVDHTSSIKKEAEAVDDDDGPVSTKEEVDEKSVKRSSKKEKKAKKEKKKAKKRKRESNDS